VDGQPALRLTDEWTLRGFPLNAGREIQGPRRPLDPAFELEYRGFPVRVIARRDPQVRSTPARVEVDGREALSDLSGRIYTGAADALGGDAALGTTYRIDGEPRLMVLRGETLEYDPGHVLVNGQRLPEPYLVDPPRYEMAPTRLAPNQYLMLGDNRNSSADSHVWGALTRERFIGRAEILFWPLPRLRVFHWWLVGVLAAVWTAYQVLRRLRSASRPPYDEPPMSTSPAVS
jgi:signal peptidase I